MTAAPRELPDSWSWRPLRELVDFHTAQVDPDSLSPSAMYVGLEHIQAHTGQMEPIALADAEVKSKKYTFDETSILYGKLRPYLNKVALPTHAGVCSTDVLPLQPKPAVDRRFLAYYLRTSEFYETAALRSLGDLPRAGARVIGRIQVPLPSPEEQGTVAAALADADRMMARAAHAADRLDELRQTVYLEIAGPSARGYDSWPRETVEQLAADVPNALRTGPFGSALLHSEFVDSGVPVLGIDNAVQNRFAWGERRFITPEKFADLKRFQIRPNDVIVTIMGTTGRVAVVPADIPTAITSKHLAALTLDWDRVAPTVVAAALRFDPRVRAQAGNGRGAIMDGLNLRIIKRLALPIPPQDVQEGLVEALGECDLLEERLSRLTDRSIEAFEALSREAFSGRLTSSTMP